MIADAACFSGIEVYSSALDYTVISNYTSSFFQSAGIKSSIFRKRKWDLESEAVPSLFVISDRVGIKIQLKTTTVKVIKRTYKWYAIYTRSKAEKKLHKELLEKGVECYLPLKKELRVWSDRKKWIESPLFTSYIFVRVSNREYYHALNSYWAVRYVCIEGRAVPIPDAQIESLKLFLDDEKRNVELTSRRLKKGDHLEVTIGPLKGVRGELVRLKGQKRLVLRFVSLGCCVHADISTDEVKRLSEPLKLNYG